MKAERVGEESRLTRSREVRKEANCRSNTTPHACFLRLHALRSHIGTNSVFFFLRALVDSSLSDGR